MDLKISNYNNFYKVRGTLNKKNIHVFQNAFKNIFENSSPVTISFVGLEEIDKHGKNALSRLHNESIAKQKSLSIIGAGSKEAFSFLNQKKESHKLQRIFLVLKKSIGL